MRKISLVLLLIITLTGCRSELKTDSNSQGYLLDSSKFDLRVLFVGNSYTFYNDLPELFVTLAASGGKAVYQDSSTANGYTLLRHADTEDKIGKITVDKISNPSQIWDYVILQEQSTCPVNAFEDFESGSKKLTDMIVEASAKPAFYMTWGRKDGFEGLSFEDMNNALETAYSEVANPKNELLVPIGSVWGKIRDEDELFSLKLWNKDGSHPSYVGSYLNACVFYAVFFNESPVGLWLDPKKISTEDAEKAQNFVADFFGFE